MNQNLTKIRHDRSVKDYPDVNFDEDEYVQMAFVRSKNSLLLSLGGLAAITVVILFVMLLLVVSEFVAADTNLGFILVILVAVIVIDFIAATIIKKVENGNKLIFTNKRLIQIMVNPPFLEAQRSINLGGISHFDYDQNTIFERLLGFGTLKFTTHEKNIMVLEDMAPKPANTLFKDNSGNVYTFTHVSVSHQDLENINQLITDAPKSNHKFSENTVELDAENL